MILIKMPNRFRSRMHLPMWLPGGLWRGWGVTCGKPPPPKVVRAVDMLFGKSTEIWFS